MGASTTTPNLDLPQFGDNDRPTWRGDVNSAFDSIDVAHGDTITELNDRYTKSESDGLLVTLVDGINGVDGAAIQTEGDKRWVRNGQTSLDLALQPNVDNTGATDSSAGINAAMALAKSQGLKVIGHGTYKIASTVTIECDCELSNATFNYTGADIAVQIGANTSGNILRNKMIVLPAIINTSKVAIGWLGDTTGVRATNTFACHIVITRINNFVTGYYAYGLGTGNVYNIVDALHLDNNKRNLVLGAGAGGWSNSNTYNLGILTHNSAEGAAVAGVRDILLDTAANIVNGNMFNGGSVEGNVSEYHVDCDGYYNSFNDLRWENAGGCRVRWNANALQNVIQYGYSARTIVETHVAGSSLNNIDTLGLSRKMGSSTKAVQVLENTSSSANAADAIMDPGATASNADVAVAYRVSRSADATKMKRASDAFARLKLDHVNGRIYIGDGTADPTLFMGQAGGTLLLSGQTVSTTAPVAGPAAALPATPHGYLSVFINDAVYKIPYY